jgi:cell division protein FtsW
VADGVTRRHGTAVATRGEPPRLRVVRSAEVRRARKDAVTAARTTIALLLAPTALLTVAGLVMVLSASSVSAYTTYGSSFWFFNRHALYALAGAGALLLTARMRYTAWLRLALPLLTITVALLLLALHPAAGASANGASRWIDLGPLTLQPSELAKLALVAFSATILARKWRRLDDPAHLAIPLAPVVLLVAGIVIMQRDLGTTVILCGSVLLLLFVAGVRLRYLAASALVGLLASGILILGEGYRRTRFLAFLHPWADAESTGYQLIQGYIALGSGGWFGVGLGASRQKWQYVPNAHTDFIFAIIGEELGFLTALVVLALFAVLIYAGVRVAVRAPDTFGRLLAAGITSWIGLQALVNLGAVTGLLPITGVPLPFLSFGGSALLVTLAGVGVLVSIARGSATSGRRKGPRGAARKAGA